MKKLLTLLLAILISLIIIVPIYSECPDHEGGDHVYDQETLVSEATCTSPAMYIKKCSCGDSDPSGAYEVGSPLGHNWVDTEISAATCTSAAIHANVCSRCGYVDENSKHSSGEPSAHNWVDTEISPKTCTEKAVHADICSVCRAEREGSRQSVGELAAHNWVDTEISAASCTSAAIHADICSVCKTEKENSRHTVGDKAHDYVETELVSATCTQPAIYAEVCTKCGETKSGTEHYEGNPAGHSPTNKSNKYLKSSATCSSSAVYYYECATCGAKCEETYEFGSPKGHSYDSWTEVDENTHSHKCTSCGHSETESHEWGEGKVVEKPTETETGITEYTCKKCGAKKTEITDKVSVDNIPKPVIDIESRHYVYTGSPITFEVPDSNFYTAKNNVQINAGEYEVEVVLNKDNYLWEDGSNKNLKFTFVIEKADYDMSQVVFENKAYIADGNSYSLEATNLPDGVSVSYSVSDVWEPGTYEVVASFVGDDNHNEIADMKAKLYILEVSENEIVGDGGNIVGIPNDVNFEVRELVEGDIEYISAKDAVINDFGIKEKDILGVVDLSLDFKGLVVEPNGSVTVTLYPSVANDEEFDLYHVHTDEFGNIFCEYVDYVLNADGTITFTLDSFSQIVFVKVTKSPLILIIIIIDIIALIALSVYIILRRSKKNKDKVNEVKNDSNKDKENKKKEKQALREQKKKEKQAAKEKKKKEKENKKKKKEKEKLQVEEPVVEEESKEDKQAQLAEENLIAEANAIAEARAREAELANEETLDETKEEPVVEQTTVEQEIQTAEKYVVEEETTIEEESLLEAAKIAEEQARLIEERRLAEQEANKAETSEVDEEDKKSDKKFLGLFGKKKSKDIKVETNEVNTESVLQNKTESTYKIEDIFDNEEE